MTAKDDILKLLPKLKPAELEEVSRAMKALQGLAGRSTIVASGTPLADGDFLIEGIAQYLVSSGTLAESSRAVYHLQRRDAYKSYKVKRPELDKFLQKLAGSLGTKGNRYYPQIAYVCASALADRLRRQNIFSVGAMLSQVDKIPEAVDDAFPGYVESGLFGFVLTQGTAR